MESFEVTFFYSKSNSINSIAVIDDLVKKVELFSDMQILVEHFDEDQKSFSEIRVSIFDLTISKLNFQSVFKDMTEFVTLVFLEFPFFELATGIYELTYYFTENIVDLNGVYEILKNFPLLFLTLEQKYMEGEVLFENNRLKCIFQKNAQELY